MTFPKKIFILAVFVISAAFAPAAFAFSGPSLWTLKDDDTTIYILGTIHLMNEGVEWQTPKIMTAYEGSETLILELGPEEFDPALTNRMIIKHGAFLDGRTLNGVIDEALLERTNAALVDMGLPANSLNAFQPWMVATVLTVQTAQNNGYLPHLGVDQVLMTRAVEEGKPVLGFETSDFQLGIFSDLSMDVQTTFLEVTLDELESINDLFIILREAWLVGDLETLDENLNSDWDIFPDLRVAILDNRNRNWADELEKLMEGEGSYFVAVGTGHLVGENNLIQLLEEKGFELSRE